MVTEMEARAIIAEKASPVRHTVMQPAHPLHWGRMVGPLMAWTVLFGFAVIGSLFY